MDRINKIKGVKMLENLLKRRNKPKNIKTKENKGNMKKKKLEKIIQDESLTNKIDELLRLFKEAKNEEETVQTFKSKEKELVELRYTKEIKLEVKKKKLEELIQGENSTNKNDELLRLFKEVEKVEEVVQTLSPKEKELIELRYRKGLKWEEVAEGMNCKVTTATQMNREVMDDLRKRFKENQ